MVISSLIIESKLDSLSAVAEALAALDGVEVHGTDAQTGRIVVTVEAENTEASHSTAAEMVHIPGVLNVNLIYANFEDENLNR